MERTDEPAADFADAQVGHRLAQLRERTGLKQADLARRVTWSPAVLSRVEAGERKISDDELDKLLTAIGTEEAAELADVLGRSWRLLPRPALDHPDQTLLWEAEQIAAELTAATEDPGVRPAFQQRLKEYVDEIVKGAELLLRREHQIAFIGSIGIGKSTAICRATGLETTGQQGRPVPVLETGGGGVTLCEVHLSSGPGFGIIVEPRSHDDIRADVEDFVDQLRQTSGSAEDGEDETPAVPREIERAIRNMTGLTPRRFKGPDGKAVRTDPAKDLAGKITERRDLVVEVLTLMGLHRRDRRDEWHSPTSTAGPLEWIRTTFERINNGRHPEFSFPARIDIVVPELLRIDDLEISVVDTRGIDQPAARADLENLLEDPHTVSILCSGFNDAPSQPIQHLLQRAREINNAQIDQNACIVILARPGEALAVKDESGLRAESDEEGYDLKGEQVSTALNPYRLSDLPIRFFNSFEDDPAALRAFVSDRVRSTRQDFRRRLTDVLDRTRLLLSNAEQEQVQAVQRDAGRHLTTWIHQHRDPAGTGGRVHDTLLDEIRVVHASTVHAAARRNGEWRSLSYSHQLGYGGRKVAVAALHDSVTGFSDLCETLRESMPEAAELLSQARSVMTAAYEELLRKLQLTSLTLYQGQLRQDSQFWLENIDEWGTGPGYRDRVLRRNRDWFQESARNELEVQITAVLGREWGSLLDRVGSIFDVAE
jgi:transcriptional regulator with XRE-family HTH domain